MTETKQLSLHGRLRMAAACPDPNASLFAEAADAIQQHEAYKQEVSDALEKRGFYIDDRDLGRFIIARPDPLVEAYNEALPETAAVHGKETVQHICAKISAALAARGLEVRKIGEGE